jgi:hypothetical protein
MKKLITICAVVVTILAISSAARATTLTMPDGSITTPPSSYGQAYSFFDVVGNPQSPDRWNIVASDLTFQGQINISNINHKARWNTWDGDQDDGVDKLGAWYMCGAYAGSGKGVWWTSPQWTGGGDTANNIRSIFHMQDRQGTQPHPKYYTGPYNTTDFAWLDDWFNFKLVIHATSNTTGTAQLWIHDELVNGQGQIPQPPIDTFTFDISGATNDLTNMRMIMWMINGDNSNNPDYTLQWRDVSITGTVVPEPTTICLLGLGALSLIRRKK